MYPPPAQPMSQAPGFIHPQQPPQATYTPRGLRPPQRFPLSPDGPSNPRVHPHNTGDTFGASPPHLYSSPSSTPSFSQIPTPTPTHDGDAAFGGFSSSELEHPTPLPHTFPPRTSLPNPSALPSSGLREPSMAGSRELVELSRVPHAPAREAFPGPSYGPREFGPQDPIHGPLVDPSQDESLPPLGQPVSFESS